MENEKRLVDTNVFFTLNGTKGSGHKLVFGAGFIDVYDGNDNYICQFDIEDIPKVDAVEVVHGRWVFEEVYPGVVSLNGYECNKCKKNAANRSNYCPNCGAKMDGDGHE